jgi:hypothetical protein
MSMHVPADDAEISNPEVIYGIYRDYIKHEDGLINRRLMSNLVLQGFLFAAYGFSIQFLRAPRPGDNIHNDLGLLPLIFSALGFSVGILLLLSIMAAQSAIDGLKKDWKDIASRIDPKMLVMLPGLTGAGSRISNLLGKVPQIGVPALVVVSWIVFAWIAR